jgi:DNA-directed RNA polymerase subunit H
LKKKAVKSIDVLSHVLVPKMEVLYKEEKAKVLKKYSVTESQMPVMLATDTEVIALKAEPGDVIKITRKAETGEYVSYRIISQA